MATVRLLCGPPRSGRPAHVERILIENWGRATLIVPTHLAAARRTERIMLANDLKGCWGTPVSTFDRFAEGLLAAEGQAPSRLRDTERRLLLERTVTALLEGGRLDSLGPGAETDGFITHMLRVITQLKQAAVEPAEFRRRVEGRAHVQRVMDGVVAEVYEAYQQELHAAGAYDVPGLFWAGHLLCQERRPRALDATRVVLLDGFDDFTPSEFRLLTSLEQHLDLLIFGLNYDDEPRRRDLYALPERTLLQINEAFDATMAMFEEAPPETMTEFAASGLFWRDKTPLPEGLEPNLEILPCTDLANEIESVGRRIKALVLDQGVSLDDIVLVLANPRDAVQTVEAVFDEFGIPVVFTARPATAESATGAFLLSLFDALADWSREAVLSVLISPWFHRGDPGEVETYPVLSRVARIVSGRKEWGERLERLGLRLDQKADGDEPTGIDRLFAQMPDPRKALASMREGLARLEVLERIIPSSATPAQFADAVDKVLDVLDLSAVAAEFAARGVDSPALRRFGQRETVALEALRGLLGQWRLWFENDHTELPRSTLLSRLRRTMQETAFRPPSDAAGILCADVDSVRHLAFAHVFFCGVNEGSVPRPPIVNAIYSEQDVRDLAEAGIQLEDRRHHVQRQLFSFKQVFDIARKHLCITWHGLNHRGQAQLPSPFLNDLKELFGRQDIEAPPPGPDAFLPAPDVPVCWRDVRNLTGAHEPERLPEMVSTWPLAFSALATGIEVEGLRHGRAPLDLYDGVLADMEIVAAVAERFSGRHPFSVQQIESYIDCPFRFFAERVLHVAPVEAPAAEFDAMAYGLLAHAALQKLHEQYRGTALGEIDPSEANAALEEAVRAAFEGRPWASLTVPRGVAAVEQKRLLALLQRHLRVERAWDEAEWKPSHFEVSFGPVRGPSADPLNHPQPFVLETPAGEVPFAGRIDRVDLQPGVDDKAVRLIDYKTSTPVAAKEIREAASVQLALYALAFEEFLVPGSRCAEAFFVQFGRTQRREALNRKKKEADWEALAQRIRQRVADCVTGIRSGRFPPSPRSTDACRYCAAHGTCRWEQARFARKEGLA